MESETRPENGRENANSKIKTLLDIAYDLAAEKNLDGELQIKIVEFAREVEDRFPDARNYEVFHALIGSTVSQDREHKKEDFPGRYSIELFLTNIIADFRAETAGTKINRAKENPWLEAQRRAYRKNKEGGEK